MSYPTEVTVVEVGPRDGLQNQPQIVSADVKIEFIRRLGASGLGIVESASFVHPKWVPQMADADEVMRALAGSSIRHPVLVPNRKGLERALAAGATEVGVFLSATETFSQRNINMSRAQAFAEAKAVIDASPVPVRGCVSMCFADPWEGPVEPQVVVDEGLKLLDAGVYELMLGDTIGVGTAAHVKRLINAFPDGPAKLAVHFHDTYGQGLSNVLAALEEGITVVDASAGGLGGCPFARSATGNLATEDLVWMLDGLGITTGVDVRAVAGAAAWLCGTLDIAIPGRAARALQPRSRSTTPSDEEPA